MLSLGYDIGSSFIKCSILDVESGTVAAHGSYPPEEMKIHSPQPGWAEQDPELWWDHLKTLTRELVQKNRIDAAAIRSIGISYQMHGLVVVDENCRVLRPSIIWCDSRAVGIGDSALNALGSEYCLQHLLNAPGNFTASKLRWVRENEPDLYKKIHKVMLPGDFIAMKLTGEISTTLSGLSEGIFWDFRNNTISEDILTIYDIDRELLPVLHPTFSLQGSLTKFAAQDLGLIEGTPVSYRAGDQLNNAFSLNVLQPGETAATAGTSGVVYGVMDNVNYDPLSRVNSFAHVNHNDRQTRLGILLCINGTGILNSWLRKYIGSAVTYEEMNHLASCIPMGSEGISILPFGNGAERMLENKNIGCQVFGVDFNRHTNAHLYRAAQEGIAFSFKYGIDLMSKMGLEMKVLRAGKANMFLSPVFVQTLSTLIGASIELYDTDGAQGAARGAAVGVGYAASYAEGLKSLHKIDEIHPHEEESERILSAYDVWLMRLKIFL